MTIKDDELIPVQNLTASMVSYIIPETKCQYFGKNVSGA